jgi:uncharacterized protein (DUF3820 family)
MSVNIKEAAYRYATKFQDLTTEEKFRLQQAVIYGASLTAEKVKDNTPNEITDNSAMPFGKFQGKAMANIPAKYLLWLYDNGCSHEGVRKYIMANIAGLKKEAGER